MDFNQVYLSREELELLRKLGSGALDRSQADGETVRRLKALRFLSVSFAPDGPDRLQITETGRSFLAFNDERSHQNIVSGWRFWVPTGIAFISLVLSIISLVVSR